MTQARAPYITSVPENFGVSPVVEKNTGAVSEKKITLEIAGSGTLDVSKSAEKETNLDVLVTNVKPVLLGIIQHEIFEEGDLAYEY